MSDLPKIGDRVWAKSHQGGGRWIAADMPGTVIRVASGYYCVEIQFEFADGSVASEWYASPDKTVCYTLTDPNPEPTDAWEDDLVLT